MSKAQPPAEKETRRQDYSEARIRELVAELRDYAIDLEDIADEMKARRMKPLTVVAGKRVDKWQEWVTRLVGKLRTARDLATAEAKKKKVRGRPRKDANGAA